MRVAVELVVFVISASAYDRRTIRCSSQDAVHCQRSQHCRHEVPREAGNKPAACGEGDSVTERMTSIAEARVQRLRLANCRVMQLTPLNFVSNLALSLRAGTLQRQPLDAPITSFSLPHHEGGALGESQDRSWVSAAARNPTNIGHPRSVGFCLRPNPTYGLRTYACGIFFRARRSVRSTVACRGHCLAIRANGVTSDAG